MATSPFKKVLIANRGEIAVRIIRSVRELGLIPVAVYSDVDQNALHVRMADEAYHIGASPSSESYLSIPKLIDTAQKCGAGAIHPGYGFLSENAAFAKAVEDANLCLIGPSSTSVEAMGDKLRAREYAEKAGLNMVPASPALKDLAHAEKEAKKIGYPVLLKAKAGGGGKGMRRVNAENELKEAFQLAQSEALKAFQNGTLYLEKYVVQPRHIEVQVFADKRGYTASIGDRECSIQRRHQKIIEEAPAANLSEKTKSEMSKAAIRIAKAVQYLGAGTVEFLVDAHENFYFLEMNTRLQVEHPVTEWVSGLDLVALQIQVAMGKPLPFTEENYKLSGHSIEARLYAEDPENRFFPSPGRVDFLAWPTGPGTRVDSAIETGSEISLYYDPMIAKISAFASNRDEALIRLQRALSETRIAGLKTNLAFLKKILAHPRFIKGKLTTTFIQEEGPFISSLSDDLYLDVALATVALQEKPQQTTTSKPSVSPWWSSGLPRARGRFFS